MQHSVFQRDRYDGVVREEAVWWTLRREATKGEAVCRMFTHVFGHELWKDGTYSTSKTHTGGMLQSWGRRGLV
jgi:hypothetical protein